VIGLPSSSGTRSGPKSGTRSGPKSGTRSGPKSGTRSGPKNPSGDPGLPPEVEAGHERQVEDLDLFPWHVDDGRATGRGHHEILRMRHRDLAAFAG